VVGAIDRGGASVDFVSVSPSSSPNCSSGNFFCYRDDVAVAATAYDRLEKREAKGAVP
jgi:hypothetical protein